MSALGGCNFWLFVDRHLADIRTLSLVCSDISLVEFLLQYKYALHINEYIVFVSSHETDGCFNIS